MDTEYYSNCCGSFMNDWPDSDICPSCGEHCSGLTITRNGEIMEKKEIKPRYTIVASLSGEDMIKLEEAKAKGWKQIEIVRIGLDFCSKEEKT